MSRITHLESLNTPISFFRPLKLIPVLPPTLASTIANRVVGMLMKSMPRLNVDAAKPRRSVIIPPPRFIKHEWRVPPPSPSFFQTWAMLSKVLLVSVEPMVITCAFFKQNSSLSGFMHFSRVVSSANMKIRSCSHSASASVKSNLKFFVIITFWLMGYDFILLSVVSPRCASLCLDNVSAMSFEDNAKLKKNITSH